MRGHQLVKASALLLLIIALFGAVYWIYTPGSSGPVMLDDRSSLGKLDNLADSPELAWDYISGENSGPLGRPVSMATFVLERLLGDGTTATAKTVNIALHLFVGALVTWFFALLLSAAGVSRPITAAALFAVFWMLAPLHVSTVLYIVQRMAMLAAFFALLALISYLHWRRSVSAGKPRHSWLLIVMGCIVLAVLSKENGVLAIPLILLTEALWLQFRDEVGRPIVWLRRFTLLVILVGTVAVAVLLLLYWGKLVDDHVFRDFTIIERILTQTRILWDYVGQFFFPDMDRLGIYHDDITLSGSLLKPVTTLYAIIGWLTLLLLVPVLWRWVWPRRILYGPMFYLAAHSMESTVWPLELYFEHRNYLPSVGLMMVPLCFYAFAVKKWPELRAPLMSWCFVAIVAVSFLVSSQVSIWSSRPLLMMQHVNGHPQSARANRDYASLLASAGAGEAALTYSERAYQASLVTSAADEHFGDYILRNVALACIAGQPLTPEEYSTLGALEPGRPLGQVFTMSVVVNLRHDDRCPEFDWDSFLDHLGSLYLTDFDTSLASANMFSALAMLANAHQQWDYAYAYNARHLALVPKSVRGMLMQLHFSTALERTGDAQGYIARLQELQRAGKLSQGEQSTLALYLEK